MRVPRPMRASAPTTAPGSTTTPSSNSSRRIDERPAARLCGLRLHGIGIEEPQRQREPAIGLGGDEGRCPFRDVCGECRREEARRGARVRQVDRILAVIEKRKIVLGSVGEGAHIGDLQGRVGAGRQLRIGRLGDVAEREWAGPLEETGMLHSRKPPPRRRSLLPMRMPSAGFEPIRAPLLALGPGTSELCRRAEAEELLFVVGLFGEDLGKVHADRADGRGPHQARADRGPDGRAVGEADVRS